MKRRKIALYQPLSGGHRGEYIEHVLSTRSGGPSGESIYILASGEVKDRLRGSYGSEIPAAQVETLSENEKSRVKDAPTLLHRSLREWRPLHVFARRHEVDHCVLLRFNQLQFALGLHTLSGLPFTVSGVFPHPYVREDVSGDTPFEYIKSHIAYQRRRLSLWLAMCNPSITSIYLLNDPTAASVLNESIDPERNRFSAIPDPVFPKADPVEFPSQGLRSRYAIDKDRYLFLLAGMLSRRKGVLNAVRAAMELDRDIQEEVALLLAGKPSPDVEPELRGAVDKLASDHAIEVRADFRFLPDAEFEQAFGESDLVLAPYLRSKGSSGILGHAARNRTPVLAPEDGLVGDLVDEYGLGTRVKADDVSDVAAGMKTCVEGKGVSSEEGMQRYVEERTIMAFTTTLLGS